MNLLCVSGRHSVRRHQGMPTFQFTQVNVFSADPLGGNPLTVVHNGERLSEAQMAALARWTNLSETTFLLPPTDPSADYYVRIFTPGGALPFAGHPTLGSCHAWLAAGGKPRKPGLVVQQCGMGLVRVRCDGPRLEFAAPLEATVLRRTNKAPIGALRAVNSQTSAFGYRELW